MTMAESDIPNDWRQVYLRIPTWYGSTDDVPLPLWRSMYTVGQEGDRWALRTRHGNVAVYCGIGPIELIDEPPPF